MKVAMIYPDRTSERAIAGYAITLTESIKKAGGNIESVTYLAGKPLSLFKKIPKILSYDVVHIQHEYNLLGWYGMPFFLLYFILWISGIKAVTTMHTLLSMGTKFKGSRVKSALRKILYFTQNRVINWCSHNIIFHAEFFKEIAIKEYGFREGKIIIIPQAIIENVPDYNKERVKKELNLSGHVYLFMGSLVPDHGHDIIIRQADKIGKTILVVASPQAVNDRNNERAADYLGELKDIVKKKGFDKFVRFDINSISDTSPLWWKYFKSADIVFLPYRGGIGSGIFAHAMAAGRPVISSNIDFFKEISEKFDCVLTANNDSEYPQLIRKAMNEDYYKKMILGCKKYMDKFGLSKVSKKYIDIYHGK